MITSPLCEMLGIQYPIFQGGMAWIADAKLAAAVSNAGGLGIISAMNAGPDYLREQIAMAKSLTDKPFGVNIMLQSPFADDVAKVVAEESVKIVTTGAGTPTKYMPMWQEAGICVIPVVASVAMAKKMERAGASAVVAEGQESGGHIGELTTMALVPSVREAVSIPVMAKCRIGHFAEAQILQAIDIDYIDESEVLSPADDTYHIDKTVFAVPFVCGARDLGEALRRIAEGATMIRTKGEPGTGDVVQAVRHMRRMNAEIRRIQNLRDDELFEAAKELQVPVELLREVHEAGKLPVVNFAAGGIATPADAALMMQLGAEGVFVGSGIFKSGDPARRAEATVKATTNFNDPEMLAALSEDLGEAMVGINEHEIDVLMAERGK